MNTSVHNLVHFLMFLLNNVNPREQRHTGYFWQWRVRLRTYMGVGDLECHIHIRGIYVGGTRILSESKALVSIWAAVLQGCAQERPNCCLWVWLYPHTWFPQEQWTWSGHSLIMFNNYCILVESVFYSFTFISDYIW